MGDGEERAFDEWSDRMYWSTRDIEELIEERLERGIWTDIQGKQHQIHQMSDGYLANCMRLLEREGQQEWVGYKKLAEEFWGRLGMP
jgi:hypothetical protein